MPMQSLLSSSDLLLEQEQDPVRRGRQVVSEAEGTSQQMIFMWEKTIYKSNVDE